MAYERVESHAAGLRLRWTLGKHRLIARAIRVSVIEKIARAKKKVVDTRNRCAHNAFSFSTSFLEL
jgi:hypothetical protein